jgi:S-adenosyl-L-methionine hydrolase (adenosine-forming)
VTKLPVAFLTDYGDGDEFAGSCRLIIERLAPGTRVIDLTHGIPPGDVRRGALALEAAARRAAPAVYLAVVDPGVGTDRRGLAIAAGASFLVGPDNGLLVRAADALGGPERAVDVSGSPLRLEPVAATFHGRDLFAPVAAHLAAGRPLDVAGEEVDRASLVALELPEARREGDALVAPVLHADRFGNLVLAADPAELDAVLGAAEHLSITAPAGRFAAVRGATFADADAGEAVGEALVVYEASSGRLAVAVNLDSASELLGADRDDELKLAPAS